MVYNIIMSATKEKWYYGESERVWVGKYKNSQNTMHWHSDCELIYVERGTLDVVHGGVSFRIQNGDAMFIDSETLHRINAVDDSSLLQTLVFDRNVIDELEAVALTSPVLSADYGIPVVYDKIMLELKNKRPLYAQQTELYIKQLLLDIFRYERTDDKRAKSETDVKLRALFDEIERHYDSYTLRDGAKFMSMNPSYLSRFFTQKTGMHFMRYVACVRVEKAVELLRGGMYNVTEIAARCGFGTIRNFNRIFKLLAGYPPTALPEGYVFTAAVTEKSGPDVNPTLSGCELVESSSL